MVRVIAVAAAWLVLLSACGSGDSFSDTETVTGFIFIDSTGSHICESMLESYPPQCGRPSTKLLDLDPESVVALMSPSDPTFAPVSWTDYGATATGTPTHDGLTDVLIADPVYEGHSDGFVLRVVDLGLATNEPNSWPFDLTNATDEDMALTFSDGQRIEVTLSDESGEVYRWSDGMLFTQAIAEIDLPAGSTFPFVLNADPTGLSAGTYTAKAWVTAPEVQDVVVTWQIEITD